MSFVQSDVPTPLSQNARKGRSILQIKLISEKDVHYSPEKRDRGFQNVYMYYKQSLVAPKNHRKSQHLTSDYLGFLRPS